MIDILFPKLHKEGYRFLAISAVVTFILLLISNFLGLISLAITVWVFYFFRDPIRSVPAEDVIVSPADGTITFIGEVDAPNILNSNKNSIS